MPFPRVPTWYSHLFTAEAGGIHHTTSSGHVVTGKLIVELQLDEDGSSIQPDLAFMLVHQGNRAERLPSELLTDDELEKFYYAFLDVFYAGEPQQQRLDGWLELICERFAAKGVLQ